MATKQATTEQNEIDFDSMSLEEIEALEKAEQEKQKKIQQAKIAKIQASKQEAFDSLIQVVNKYHLTGVDVISTLLNNGKIDFKDLSKIEPVKLLTKQVQKKKKAVMKWLMLNLISLKAKPLSAIKHKPSLFVLLVLIVLKQLSQRQVKPILLMKTKACSH